MARIGSALLALTLASLMCGTVFAAGKKGGGGGHGKSSKSSSGKKSGGHKSS